jgi:hypothetical protein
VLERALRQRPGLVSVAELPGSAEQDAFVQASQMLVFLSPGGKVTQGSHAELMGAVASYGVVVTRHGESLLERLIAAGYEARGAVAGGVWSLVVRDTALHGTEPLLRAALQADAPIIELMPLNVRPRDPARVES